MTFSGGPDVIGGLAEPVRQATLSRVCERSNTHSVNHIQTDTSAVFVQGKSSHVQMNECHVCSGKGQLMLP